MRVKCKTCGAPGFSWMEFMCSRCQFEALRAHIMAMTPDEREQWVANERARIGARAWKESDSARLLAEALGKEKPSAP